MVKVFALLPRRLDVTDDYFHEHWSGPHAELALRISTIRRYVQSHRVGASIATLGAAPYEGIAEVWFVDAGTAAGMGEDPDYANYAHLDEPNFIDTERLAFVMTHEHVIRAGEKVGKDDSGVKAMLLLRRASDLSPAAFAQRVTGLDYAVPAAQRISLAVALPESYADGADPACDAILEIAFGDGEAFAAAQPDIEALIERGLRDAIEKSRSLGFVAEELRVVWPDPAPVGA